MIGDMQARGHKAKQVAPAAKTPSTTQPAQTPTIHVAPAMHETDQARVQILSRPVPSDTRAAAEIALAVPLPKDPKVEMPSAEQTAVLAYGQFAPIAARVFNNATKQNETHWTLHPWDVARLADQASAELYKERRIRVEPRLIAGATTQRAAASRRSASIARASRCSTRASRSTKSSKVAPRPATASSKSISSTPARKTSTRCAVPRRQLSSSPKARRT